MFVFVKTYEFEIPSVLADSVSSCVVISVSAVIQIHCVMCSKNKMTGLSQKPEKRIINPYFKVKCNHFVYQYIAKR